MMMMMMMCNDAAIQMGRPSKTRNGSDTSNSDVNGSMLTSPINLSFQASASAPLDGHRGPVAHDGPRARDVSAQQPDSTVDRCPVSRKRPSTSVNVLRQLQSPSATKMLVGRGKHSSSLLWRDGGENVALADGGLCAVDRSHWTADVVADLAVIKRAHVQSATPGTKGLAERLTEMSTTSQLWSRDVEDTCRAATVCDWAVGSPSVTSSGRRDSLDDDDETELMAADCERTSPSSSSAAAAAAAAVLPSSDVRRHRRRSSVDQLDKKQTGSQFLYSRLGRATWLDGKSRFSIYTIRKIIYPSFLRRRMVGGGATSST